MPSNKHAATDDIEAREEVEKLREQIFKLTGRVPVSVDLRYLKNRLDALREQKKNGEIVRREFAEPSAILNASMPASAKEATERMAQRSGASVSKLVRDALHEYARKHHPSEADNFATEET